MATDEWSELEEFLEFADDPADVDLDLFDDSEGSVDGAIIRNTSTAEHWINGQGILHVHLRVRPRFGEAQAGNICLAFVSNWLGTDKVLPGHGAGVPPVHFRNLFRRGLVCVLQEGSVLVDVRQSAQHRQGTTEGGFPSSRRLYGCSSRMILKTSASSTPLRGFPLELTRFLNFLKLS